MIRASQRLARRAQIAGSAGHGLLARARSRLSAGPKDLDPRASGWWAPHHALLERRGLVGATSAEERAFCHWYARCAYQGPGAVVDLGSWLGSTTVPLALGMAQRPRGAPSVRIRAYDRFVWEPWMNDFVAGGHFHDDYQPGDDFRPALERALGPHGRLVDIHTADLRTERWDRGPIEMVVVDAMKSWDLARNILAEFLTAVVPGGVIFHQDFAHYHTPWIHLIGYRLRDQLELYYDVPNSGGAAFRVVSSLDGIETATLASADAYDDDDVSAAFEHSRGLAGADKQASITAAEAMWHVHTGDLDRAEAIIMRARDRGLRGDLDTAERYLQEARHTSALTRAGDIP